MGDFYFLVTANTQKYHVLGIKCSKGEEDCERVPKKNINFSND